MISNLCSCGVNHDGMWKYYVGHNKIIMQGIVDHLTQNTHECRLWSGKGNKQSF